MDFVYLQTFRETHPSGQSNAEGWKDQKIIGAFDICQATVANVCKRYAEGGLQMVLYDKAQQHRR